MQLVLSSLIRRINAMGYLPIFPECWESVDVVNPLKASFSMVAIRVLPAMILGCVWCAEKSVSVCAVHVT